VFQVVDIGSTDTCTFDFDEDLISRDFGDGSLAGQSEIGTKEGMKGIFSDASCVRRSSGL
jgi:hypothetical protein